MPLIEGAILSGAGSLIQNGVNSYAVHQQNKQNMRNWREQNAYNSPMAQRKRYEDAGLNPALMYQQGNSGNAAPPPNSEKQNIDITAFGNMVQTYLDLKKKDVDIENTKADTDLKGEDKYTKNEMNNWLYEKMKAEKEARDLENKGKKMDNKTKAFDLGLYEPENPDAPINQRFQGDLKKLLQDWQIGELRRSGMDKANERDSWEFENDKKLKEQYDINPDDTSNLRILKTLAKDFYNTDLKGLKEMLYQLVK